MRGSNIDNTSEQKNKDSLPQFATWKFVTAQSDLFLVL